MTDYPQQWQYEDDDKTWKAFPDLDSSYLEQMFGQHFPEAIIHVRRPHHT